VYQFLPDSFLSISASLVMINLLLAVFNLIPISPLDGSKIVFGFLPYRFLEVKDWIERHSIFVFLFFIFFLWQFVDPIIAWLFHLVTGV